MIAVPLRSGESARPGLPLPDGWRFEAPPRPDPTAGFAVFEGDPGRFGDDPSWLGMTFREAQLFIVDLDVDMDWASGTCAIEVQAWPEIEDVSFELEVYHKWCCDADCDEESGEFTGTTDADGQLGWTFHVTVRCPEGYEYLALNLYRIASSGRKEWVADEILEVR
jgi:hypothetical protein